MIRSAYPSLRAHNLVQIGYPPPDVHLRTWLLSGNTNDEIAARKKLHAFVYALLTVTRTMLEAIDRPSKKVEETKTGAGVESRRAILASTFRDLMTKGQSYKGPNDYRERFYNQVTQLADKVSSYDFPHSSEDDDVSKFMEGIQQTHFRSSVEPEEFNLWVSKDREGVKDAGTHLVQFVDPNNLLDCVQGQPRRPLVILAFDEAHILTDRILRQTSDQAIFSLFLSTAGHFNLFSPDIRSDPSRRIRNFSLGPLDPITETSFDNLAYDAPEGKIELSRVVEMDWMCHLGRPLYVLFDYRFNEQLTSHLEQVRGHLQRRRVQKRDRPYGPREGEVARWSDCARNDESGGLSSLSLCALCARIQYGRDSWRRSPYTGRTPHEALPRGDY